MDICISLSPIACLTEFLEIEQEHASTVLIWPFLHHTLPIYAWLRSTSLSLTHSEVSTTPVPIKFLNPQAGLNPVYSLTLQGTLARLTA